MEFGKKIKNIILVGLMGSGKTTVGMQLSKFFKKKFIDTDSLIESKTGVNVMTIFELEGEQGFRRREKNLLNELLGQKNLVIATGGGIVIEDENRRLLQQLGTIFYLKANPLHLSNRLKKDKTRPLLQNVDLFVKLNDLFTQRDRLYRSVANYIIETENKKLHEIKQEIITKIS